MLDLGCGTGLAGAAFRPFVDWLVGVNLSPAMVAQAAAKGLSVQPDGSGVARVQSPPPGAILHQGERIRVQFAR